MRSLAIQSWLFRSATGYLVVPLGAPTAHKMNGSLLLSRTQESHTCLTSYFGEVVLQPAARKTRYRPEDDLLKFLDGL